VAVRSKNQAWLDLVEEQAIDPEIAICDPHHHLWDRQPTREQERYLIDEMLEDLSSGHNIVSTVFVECSAMFKTEGPEAFRCVGETEFVNGIAAMCASGTYGKTRIAKGIIGTVDFRIGDVAADVLDAHIAAGGGRFCGIRLGAVWLIAVDACDDGCSFSGNAHQDRRRRPSIHRAVEDPRQHDDCRGRIQLEGEG